MVFNTLTKIILTPIYYIIHHNYLFGFIHKFFVKNFYYKNMKFELKINTNFSQTLNEVLILPNIYQKLLD